MRELGALKVRCWECWPARAVGALSPGRPLLAFAEERRSVRLWFAVANGGSSYAVVNGARAGLASGDAAARRKPMR